MTFQKSERKIHPYPTAQLINLSPPKKYNRRIFNKQIRTTQFIVENNHANYTNKPFGGLWTSTYNMFDYNYQSEWIEWCNDNQDNWIGHTNVLIEVDTCARVFTIDCVQDMKGLYFLYPDKDEKSARIDWVKVQKDWDIVHLTSAGSWLCSSPYYIKSYNRNKPLSLYGWDCESSLMLNNVINRFKKITTTINRR